jgi:hypothetical protein
MGLFPNPACLNYGLSAGEGNAETKQHQEIEKVTQMHVEIWYQDQGIGQKKRFD